jgi:hypothetical protein
VAVVVVAAAADWQAGRLPGDEAAVDGVCLPLALAFVGCGEEAIVGKQALPPVSGHLNQRARPSGKMMKMSSSTGAGSRPGTRPTRAQRLRETRGLSACESLRCVLLEGGARGGRRRPHHQPHLASTMAGTGMPRAVRHSGWCSGHALACHLAGFIAVPLLFAAKLQAPHNKTLVLGSSSYSCGLASHLVTIQEDFQRHSAIAEPISIIAPRTCDGCAMMLSFANPDFANLQSILGISGILSSYNLIIASNPIRNGCNFWIFACIRQVSGCS